MVPTTNARAIFASIPTGYPVVGETIKYDTTQSIDLETVPLNGGVLLKVLVLSVDPYFRGMMREAHIKSYAPAYTLGAPSAGGGIGVVIRSEIPNVAVGTYIRGSVASATSLKVGL